MPLLDKLSKGAAEGIIGATGKLLDELISSPTEKLEAKNRLAEIVLARLQALNDAQRDVLLAEMKGSLLQRNWRPVVMLTFAFIIVYHYFLQPLMGFWLEVPTIQLPDQFWTLLEIGLGGYVIGRSVEKVADKLTLNVDRSLLTRRERRRDQS